MNGLIASDSMQQYFNDLESRLKHEMDITNEARSTSPSKNSSISITSLTLYTPEYIKMSQAA